MQPSCVELVVFYRLMLLLVRLCKLSFERLPRYCHVAKGEKDEYLEHKVHGGQSKRHSLQISCINPRD